MKKKYCKIKKYICSLFLGFTFYLLFLTDVHLLSRKQRRFPLWLWGHFECIQLFSKLSFHCDVKATIVDAKEERG